MFVMLRNGTKDISTGEPETRVWYSRFLLRATDVHPDHLPAGVQLRAEEIWVRLESVLFYPPPRTPSIHSRWGSAPQPINSAEDTHVFPAQRGLAVFTVDIGNGVQSCEQDPLLSWAAPHVHPETQPDAACGVKWCGCAE